MTTSPGRSGTSLDALTELLDLRPSTTGRPEPGRARLGVVAGRRGPRFLVPLDHPDATVASCLAYLGLRDVKTRLARGSVVLALRARQTDLVARQVLSADAGEGSLIALLADLLAEPGEEPGLAVAVGMGHRDEVWKPTLQVFRPDGSPAAFVKVGLGPVGAELVRTEAAALAAWDAHPDPRLVTPGLVASVTWRTMPVAVVAPLPLDVHRLPAPVSAWPVRSLDGPPRRASLDGSPWWHDLRARLGTHPVASRLVERIEARHGDRTELDWARWHGDWVSWNLARCHRGLVAWDWEYSQPDAPVGLDEVHGAYQRARVVQGRPIAESLDAARQSARALGDRAPSPATVADLRSQTATATPSATFGSPDWLADAHVAMLVGRSLDLESLAGVAPADRDELVAAADAAIGAAS